MADTYIEAAGIDAPATEPPQDDPWLPQESGTRLSLDAENITSTIWATCYGPDFGFLDIPVLDEWNYPRHSRGVTEVGGTVRRGAAVADPAHLALSGLARSSRFSGTMVSVMSPSGRHRP